MRQAFDPYQTLQVIPEAEPEVIQAAFRTLARKHHPDMGGSEETMAVLNEAWAVLRDRHRRALYDRERASAAAIDAARAAAAPTKATTTKAAASPAASPAGPTSYYQPAPASDGGTMLDFGRYQGIALREVAYRDPDYLEWLVRTRIGSRFRREVDELLAPSRVSTATGRPVIRQSRFRRR